MSLVMADLQAKKPLSSRIIKTDLINWRELQFLQQDDFKSLSIDARNRLKASILADNFTAPFYVWQAPETGIIYCLDGRHRTLLLDELSKEGYDIPYLLPATFIECANKAAAARLVLLYSSLYARVTESGFSEFIDLYGLDLETIGAAIDIPDIDLSKIIGDTEKDFSARNEELELDAFKDEVVLKLTYTRDEYIKIKERISELLGAKNISTPEELFKVLLIGEWDRNSNTNGISKTAILQEE